MNLSPRPLAITIAAALALLGCSSLDPHARAAPTVKPVQSVRHGMKADDLYLAGRALHEQDRNTEAVFALKQALMANPFHVDTHNALGVIYSLQGDAAAAEVEFRMAAQLAPEAAYIRENLALHLSRYGTQLAASAAPVLAPPPRIEPAVVTPLQSAELPVGTPLAESPPVVTLASPPAAEPAPMPAAAPPAAAPSNPAARAVPERVEISNGNGATGLARSVSEMLPPDAFAPARLTNATPYGAAPSVIQHTEAGERFAREINALLPMQLPLSRVATLERNQKVRVLLGNDFPRDKSLLTREAAAARLAAAENPLSRQSTIH